MFFSMFFHVFSFHTMFSTISLVILDSIDACLSRECCSKTIGLTKVTHMLIVELGPFTWCRLVQNPRHEEFELQK
jgi:hypothetical protein